MITLAYQFDEDLGEGHYRPVEGLDVEERLAAPRTAGAMTSEGYTLGTQAATDATDDAVFQRTLELSAHQAKAQSGEDTQLPFLEPGRRRPTRTPKPPRHFEPGGSSSQVFMLAARTVAPWGE